MNYELFYGNCTDYLPTIQDYSIDAIISDPPYPEIDRDYGRMTEKEWLIMMKSVVNQSRRVLKPTGSAVFILQPNSEKAGRMRGWLWKFIDWCCDEWNVIQDAYWWNINAMPNGGATTQGLMRGSIKYCVWCGNSDCYRNQSNVLWDESLENAQRRLTARAERVYGPSGNSYNKKTQTEAAVRRGGVTPFNVLPFAGSNDMRGGGVGHSAPTPLGVSDWWTRYICPEGGTVLDPFAGSGTMAISAFKYGCLFRGSEKHKPYYELAKQRIESAARAASGLPRQLNGSANDYADSPLFAMDAA